MPKNMGSMYVKWIVFITSTVRKYVNHEAEKRIGYLMEIEWGMEINWEQVHW